MNAKHIDIINDSYPNDTSNVLRPPTSKVGTLNLST